MAAAWKTKLAYQQVCELMKNLGRLRQVNFTKKLYSTSDEASGKEVYAFLKAQSKFDKIPLEDQNSTPKTKQAKPKPFARLLRESPVVQAGDLSQNIVYGKIVQRVDDDIYIDYGGKFHCVCKVPKLGNIKDAQERKADEYQVGRTVVVKILDEELTARFMGYDRDMTLLEANGQLVRLHRGRI